MNTSTKFFVLSMIFVLALSACAVPAPVVVVNGDHNTVDASGNDTVINNAQPAAATQAPTATPAPQAPTATTAPTAIEAPAQPARDLTCDGCAWEINSQAKTITWVGPTTGAMDIHQGDAEVLKLVRSGYKAQFHTDVPGTVIISVGNIDGIDYTTETKVDLEPGDHTISGSYGPSGGFRWSPAAGHGWRK